MSAARAGGASRSGRGRRAGARAPRQRGGGRSRREAYEELGPTAEELAVPELEAAFEPEFSDFADMPDVGELEEGQALGRVVRLDRGYPLVVTPVGAVRAEHAIALVKGVDMRSCLGDWAVLRLPQGHDKAVIERILPRASELARWDGRARGQRQVLAANVDLVMVAQPLSDRPVSTERLARSAVLACEGSMRIAALLTKADRATPEGLARDEAAVRACLGPDADVVVVSSRQGTGLDDVRALLPAGHSGLLLGESGAGKSTLVNTLLGTEVLGTTEVRDRDDRGRHTTVARRMFKLPGAGLVVDAPGLRSLRLLDEERGLALAYPEVARLEEGCRFRDCTHGSEPGCMVREGVAAGEVSETRLAQYRALATEMFENRRSLDYSAKSSITQ